MELRLLLHVLGVALLVAASLTAMADQSGRLVGVHEVPPFVAGRVELPPAVPVAGRPLPGDPPAIKPAKAGA